MTATLHRIPARPASRHIEAARMTLADESASTQARLNAADMMTLFGDDLDAHDAAAYRRELIEEIEAARAPFAWVQDEPPARPWHVVFMLAAVIVASVAFAAWAEGVMTDAAAAALDATEAADAR